MLGCSTEEETFLVGSLPVNLLDCRHFTLNPASVISFFGNVEYANEC